MSETRADIVVTGRVQGVGFRDFTERAARRFSLSGRVRNRADGSVHIIVEGPEETVQEFLKLVRRGPSASRVSDVSVTWGAATGDLGEFITDG